MVTPAFFASWMNHSSSPATTSTAMDLPLVPQPKKYESEDSFVASCLKNIALSLLLEHQYLVCPHRPLGQFRQRAAARPLGDIVLAHAARIHARPADADLAAMPDHIAEHRLGVIETLWHFLVAMGGRGAIADQKDAH